MATCSREGFQSFGFPSSVNTERTFRCRGSDEDWITQDKAARVGIGLTLVFVQLLSQPPHARMPSRFTLRTHNEWPGKIDRLG